MQKKNRPTILIWRVAEFEKGCTSYNTRRGARKNARRGTRTGARARQPRS